MAFGPEVGSVTVRVHPDTRGFRRDAREQLRRLKDQLGELKVKIVLDDKHVSKQFKDWEKKTKKDPVKAQVKADLDAFQKRSLSDLKKIASKLETEIPLTPNGEKMREKLAKQLKDIEGRIKAEIPVDAELAAGVRRKLRDEMDALSLSLKADPVTVDVDSDTRRAREQLHQLIRDLPKLAEDGSGVRVNIDEDHVKSSLRGLIAELKAEAALAGVTIDVDIDTPVLKRAAIASGSLAASMQRTSDNAKKVSDNSRGILPLSRWTSIIAAGFALAAPAVGLVASLLTGLPSLLSMVGAGAAVVALGMDGIKNAAKTIQPQFDDLKKSVASVFEKNLTPQFAQLAGTFNALKPGLAVVAQGLTDISQGMLDVASSPQGLAKVNGILAATGGFFTQLKPVMASFTSSFLTLGQAGAGAFHHLLAPISNFASQWESMVNRITSSGAFDGAMAGLSATLDGIFSLFTRLAEAGVGAMDTLGPALQTGLGGLGDLLVGAMPALTSLSAGIANTIGSLGTALAPAFAALTPVIDALMPTIVQLGTILGGAISQAVIALAPVLTQLAQVLGPVLTTALQALAPIIAIVAQTLGEVLLAAVTALAPFMPQLVSAFVALASVLASGMAEILPLLAQVFQQLLTAIIPLLPALLQLVEAVFPLIPAFFKLVGAGLQVVSALMPLVNILAKIITFAAELIALFVGLAATIIAEVANMATTVISWFANMISTVLSAIGGFISNAVAWFQDLPGKIVSAVGDLGSTLINAGRALLDGLLAGIKAGWEKVKGFVGNIAGWIADLKGPLPYDKKVLVPNGQALMDGLKTGIENGSQEVFDTVSTIAQGIAEAMKNGANAELKLDPKMLKQITDPKFLDELKKQEEDLNLRSKSLNVLKDNAPDKMAKAGLQAQLDQINARKREINLIQEAAKEQQAYGAEIAKTQDDYASKAMDVAKIPFDFAKSTANQFLGDLGISGSGALSELANYGMEFGSKFVFNVSNVNEALSAQSVIQNKQAAGILPR